MENREMKKTISAEKMMKPTCCANTTELASSAKLNTYKYNFVSMCGCIIPLKSKLYYDELKTSMTNSL